MQTEGKGVCVASHYCQLWGPHLLSVQSSVVQAGHTALEAQFCHPIVDQQEVSQLREKRIKTSPPPRLPGVRSTACFPLGGGGGSNLTSNPEKQLNSYSRFLVAAAAPSRPGRAAHATSALGAQSRPGSKFSQVTKNLKVWLQYRPAHVC